MLLHIYRVVVESSWSCVLRKSFDLFYIFEIEFLSSILYSANERPYLSCLTVDDQYKILFSTLFHLEINKTCNLSGGVYALSVDNCNIQQIGEGVSFRNCFVLSVLFCHP